MLTSSVLVIQKVFCQQIRASSATYARKKLKDYKFLEILNEDCEQQYIKGWGPGGQKVNKTHNAVLMRHIPTNCVVKVCLLIS